MKVYLDTNYRCHAENDGTYREVETNYFDGKCPDFIDGYRYVPAGETWTRSDGVEFTGEMITPAANIDALAETQRAYEHQLYLDALAALDAIYAGQTE